MGVESLNGMMLGCMNWLARAGAVADGQMKLSMAKAEWPESVLQELRNNGWAASSEQKGKQVWMLTRDGVDQFHRFVEAARREDVLKRQALVESERAKVDLSISEDRALSAEALATRLREALTGVEKARDFGEAVGIARDCLNYIREKEAHRATHVPTPIPDPNVPERGDEWGTPGMVPPVVQNGVEGFD